MTLLISGQIEEGAALPTIRISDDSLKRLKAWAEPLEDSADSALRKALDAAERFRAGGAPEARSLEDAGGPWRPEPGTAPRPRLAQDGLRRPLLETLHALGGRARVRDLRPAIGERLASRLGSGDFDRLKSGEERWWNAVQWERYKLKEEGYLRADSRRGVWELSEKGSAFVAAGSADAPQGFVDHLLAIPDVGEDSDFDRPRSGPRRVEL